MDDTNSLIEQRRTKLAALKSKGIDPFQNKFTPDSKCNDARSGFDSGKLPEGTKVLRRRSHHRASRDGQVHLCGRARPSGRIQVYAQKQALGDEQLAQSSPTSTSAISSA
jgi:lysyl-tRNA synthetase class 2